MSHLLDYRDTSFSAGHDPRVQQVPAGLWVKCPACRALTYRKQLEANLKVCPYCDHHFRLSAHEWIELFDRGSFEEHDCDLGPADPLGFVASGTSYASKLRDAQARTSLAEAVVCGICTLEGRPLVLAVCDFRFMGASMGSVYGEKIRRSAERAADLDLPLLTINSSGGARMQEGVVALMQMAKTTMAMTRLAAARQPHIALLVDPCYGGVTASYATTADVIIAEPGAQIGFAGKRVIEQTIGEQLPPDFQTAEFLLQHGMIDLVVPRRDLRMTLSRLLRLHDRREPLDIQRATRHSMPVNAPQAMMEAVC